MNPTSLRSYGITLGELEARIEQRARELERWARVNDGAETAASLVERFGAKTAS